MDDGDFQRTAFPILAKEIFEAVHASQKLADDDE
jgi:type I restriction enzyme R subunit